jgi:hypothetical protein
VIYGKQAEILAFEFCLLVLTITSCMARELNKLIGKYGMIVSRERFHFAAINSQELKR